MLSTRPISAIGRFLVALIALTVLGFLVFEYVDDHSHERQLHTDYRAPVTNPPVDPNRPDLFEEPRLDE